jgi:hypothetical protein
MAERILTLAAIASAHASSAWPIASPLAFPEVARRIADFG